MLTLTSEMITKMLIYMLYPDYVHGVIFFVGSAATARWSLMSVAAAIIIRYM